MAAEWKTQQEKEKNEEITIAYVYWDGSSHRKNTRMKKGATIAQFLAKAIEVEFPLDVCVLFFLSIFDFFFDIFTNSKGHLCFSRGSRF